MTEQEIRNFWNTQKQEAITSRQRVSEFIDNKKVTLITQRREMHKLIIQLVVGFIAAPYLLGLKLNESYFVTGISILLFLVIFLILYLREIIDIEDNGLQKINDNFMDMFQEKIDLIEKYETGIVNDTNFKGCVDEYSNSPAMKKAKEIQEATKLERKNRFNNVLDYTGEFINFLFLSGLLWIGASLFTNYFNWITIVFGEILIFILTSINFSSILSKFYSSLHHYIRKI